MKKLTKVRVEKIIQEEDKKMEEKYDVEKEMEKVCTKNKIFWTDPLQHDSIKANGLLPLALNEIQRFLERKEINGFYLLYITDPDNKKAKYGFRIKYMGGAEPEKDEKEEKMDMFDLDIWDFDKQGNKKISVDKCANYLTEKYIFKTIAERNDFKTFVFRGNYDSIGNGFIKVEIEKLIDKICNNHLVAEILSKVQRKTYIEKEIFEKVPINIIPFGNGGYNLETKELEAYKPEWNFKTKLNANYIKGASCKEFKKYLEKTIYPDDLDLIQELFGFCLYRKYFLKKGFIFVGDKNTGKTTLINILVALIGIKNCSGLSLQKIGVGKAFDLCSLYDKYLNFYDDLSAKDLVENAGFKIATGGGYITAEKKFGDLFQFMPFAKLIFATNKIPPVKDLDDEALFIRNIITQFDNEVSENEIDSNLTEKLTTDKELSGIVNWALEGLHKLLKNQKFSFNKTIEEIKVIMCRSGNPLFSFVADVLEKKEGSKITKEQMFEIYKIYADEKKLTPLSKEQLGRQIQKIAPWIADKKDERVGGRYWGNVGIVSNLENDKINKIKLLLPTLPTSKNNIYNTPEGINKKLHMYKNKVGKVGMLKGNLDKCLDNFSDEEIKKAGYESKKQLKKILEETPTKTMQK